MQNVKMKIFKIILRRILLKTWFLGFRLSSGGLGVEKTESSINVYKDMKWLPLHLRRQVHLSSYMLKILNGQSPLIFINKLKFISGGSRDGANCNFYTPKSKNLKKVII